MRYRVIAAITAMLLFVVIAHATSDCAVTHCVYVPLVAGGNGIAPTNTPTQGLRVTDGPSPTIAPTPLPKTVHVKSYRMTTDGIGDEIVYGEILNETVQTVYSVQIIAKFFDAQDIFVGTNNTFAMLSRLDPDRTDPFALYLFNAPAGIVRVELSVSFSLSSPLSYQSIAILSAQSRDNSGVEIFGEVQNDQRDTLRNVKVVATFYDATGNVFDADFAYADITDIPPGGTSTYKISTFKPELHGLSALIQNEGYFPP